MRVHVCHLCFRQASNLVATDVDEQPIAQATRTTHFEGENSTAMEVKDAESLGLGEPVRRVADLENAAAEASPALTLAVVLWGLILEKREEGPLFVL